MNKTGMKPTLFSTPMVQAILDGRKTQTRRVAKQELFMEPYFDIGCMTATDEHGDWHPITAFARFQTGDVLWVRETWQYAYDMDGNDQIIDGTGKYLYAASPEDCPRYTYWVDSDTGEHKDVMPWRPSIFMPRAAARIFLRVTDVRAERVQDITEEDVLAEGIHGFTKDGDLYKYCTNIDDWAKDYKHVHAGDWWREMPRTAKDAYRHLWDKINFKRGYGWDKNPWEWAYTFERIEKPEEGT